MPSKNMFTLNNGWPFGDGPMTKGLRIEQRDDRLFLVCASCPQVVMAVSDEDPEGVRPYVVTLELLKSRTADHWLRVHAEEIAAETYC